MTFIFSARTTSSHGKIGKVVTKVQEQEWQHGRGDDNQGILFEICNIRLSVEGLAAYVYYTGFNQGHSIGMYFMLAISALLFPFAKFLVETLAFKYTTREYWSRDCLLRPRQRMASTLFTIWLA